MISRNHVIRIFLSSFVIVFFFHVTTIMVNINKYSITRIMLDAVEEGIDFADTYNFLSVYSMIFYYTLFGIVVGCIIRWFMIPRVVVHMRIKRSQDGDKKYDLSENKNITSFGSDELNRDALDSSDQPSYEVILDEVKSVEKKSDYKELVKKVDDLTR